MGYGVGIDVGSVSINAVVIDERGGVVFEMPYLRHFGLVEERVVEVIEGILARYPEAGEAISFTGVQGERIARELGAFYEVETICQVVGVVRVRPGSRTIISMGGQDASLFQLGYEASGQWHLEAFNINGPCASGTGSFIDQQAERLQTAIYAETLPDLEEGRQERILRDFIGLGLRSTSPAPVACRCTVFTKSDMIHLQNKGESLPNIISGLHYGNAANYLSTIVGNRELAAPMVMIGGMASNELQVRAFRHYYPSLEVPPHHTSLGALGVALEAQSRGTGTSVDPAGLKREGNGKGSFPRAKRLFLEHTRFDPDNALPRKMLTRKKPVWTYLGIDVGSTTTKYALIDEAGSIVSKCYVPTRGKPIEVAKELLATLYSEVGSGGAVKLRSIATTGSGRNVVGDFVGADLIIDEITAHARGAVAVDPEIDTIFEIGGQDSKYIRIENTHPLDFDMNKVCAAGTGSFLHELANKMRINIVGEFSRIALGSQSPVHLAERCTVFMESDLVGYAQKGAQREDLIAGLCYAIVYNYLNRVVEKRPVGQRVMFLGGPSLNQGIVAAFERVIERPVLVPRHREVMGAFGAALAVREMSLREGAGTRALDLEELARREVSFSESICRADKKCHNECKLKVYSFGGHKSVWGGECGRYEVRGREEKEEPNLFKVRQEIFSGILEGLGAGPGSGELASAPRGRVSIGIPQSLHGLEWGVLWAGIFSRLGFGVVVSPRSDNRIALAGVESMTSETCFPVKVFHGHVRHLLDRVEYLFLPNVINMPSATPEETGYFCPLVSSSQYMVRAALRIADERLIRPTLYLKDGPEELSHALFGSLPAAIRPELHRIREAVEASWAAQMEFRAILRQRGEQAIAETPAGEPLWVVTGRPYNLYDDRLNLQLGRHLGKLGIRALPMDFIDVEQEDLSDFPSMYWGLGARILRVAKRIARTPGWYGVHLTNFSCGADSFIEHFYRHVLARKPSLVLELDEHSAVAGLLTRIEAYRNVVKNLQEKEGRGPRVADLSVEAEAL